MSRDPRYDVLFEQVAIGPVTAPNRFYQVPHCTGMGRDRPQSLAAMRGVKAEGGWGVVNTEYCSIHPSSDDTPYPYASLWDNEDIKANALMVEAVKQHGSLAGVELWYGGNYVANLASRQPSMDLVSIPSRTDPVQCRVMDRRDIVELRRWHRDAAKRAATAGFDIVYVYATHGYLLNNFLSKSTNHRVDEYGGSVENRMRIVRELLLEARDAIGPDRALAIRFSMANVGGYDVSSEELKAMMESLGPLADIWDVVVDDYSMDMGSSRFVEEGAQESFAREVRELVGKPVVGVGRFTSPDTMARMISSGVLDFIGAARPSIADPFLPNKISDGRIDEIRECIGCNICYASDSRGNPIRCTQNPTMGEEWRSGWHPEKVEPAASDSSVLIVGAGPAGLEAAVTLARRGYQVTLADAANTSGGRVTRESALPGLGAWSRVRDHRLQLMNNLPNLELFLASPMGAQDIVEFDATIVAIATGARWRRDGIGREHRTPVTGFDLPGILTPDDIMDMNAEPLPAGPVVIYDDDGYYMAVVLAEQLVADGHDVTLVTTGTVAAEWTAYTDELHRSNARLIELGVNVIPNHLVNKYDGQIASIACLFSGKATELDATSLLTVTSRTPVDALYYEILELAPEGIQTIERIGDCLAPALIAHAVHAGHRFAREVDCHQSGQPSMIMPRREIVTV
ncbi:MAG: methylamine [marine bacterium B5-7]|nr:MAG: methylamine [marine bacterium B5-7]